MPEGVLTVVLIVGLLLLAAWQGTTNLRLNRMLRHYRMLSTGVEGQTLDHLLQRVLERSEMESRNLEMLEERLRGLSQDVLRHVQHVGMVRYNAFQDTGGDQSFALAMLDANGNGAIVNGIFHRTECRVYAKPLQDWKSTYSMSDEEEEAIRRAREGEA
ncbi:MAG: hypothetical protein QOE92_1783 [Chloroflexota bacterium]|jgi:hypothetical protein|nr:hypothetical protein [Chloroflexota bacterium]